MDQQGPTALAVRLVGDAAVLSRAALVLGRRRDQNDDETLAGGALDPGQVPEEVDVLAEAGVDGARVLEELFDFYFVRPAASRRRREKLNEKLKDAGKPELRAAQS